MSLVLAVVEGVIKFEIINGKQAQADSTKKKNSMWCKLGDIIGFILSLG